MQKPLRRHLLVALFGLLCAGLLIALNLAGFFTSTDNRLTDQLTVYRPAAQDIIIVAIDDKSIQELGVWPWPRSVHAKLIDQLSAADAKVIGYDITFSEASNSTDDLALSQAIKNSGRVVLAAEQDLPPASPFASAAAQTGQATLLTDHDGVVRQAVTKDSFGLAVAGSEAPFTQAVLRIPFVGPPGTFKTFSASDVLNGRVAPTTFAAKTVLVGATAPDLHDSLLTPVSHGELMNGVEAHANIIQALRQNLSLRVTTGLMNTGLIVVLTLLIMALTVFLRLRYFFLAIIGLVIAYLLVVVGASATGLLLPVTAPILLIILFGGVDLLSHYLEEQSRRQFIHRAFAHYLAPSVIEKLVRGETKLELGGVKRELTILFSDIRGFTSLSEKMKPEELVPFLNEYLTAMTDIVLESEGVVDKYIGDAIMAFWGAPIKQEDHAVRAALTAVKMKRRLAELQTDWSKSGKPRIDIGVGLNTGEVLVGNMGSKQRFDYTVIGDDVNLASRLEGLTKQYGVTALISEATKNKLGTKFIVRELDLVAVKGRTQPVRIFELVEEAGQENKTVIKNIQTFEQALKLYRAQRWTEAKEMFSQLSDADKPSAVFLERTDYLQQHPPGSTWDGSFTAKEK